MKICEEIRSEINEKDSRFFPEQSHKTLPIFMSCNRRGVSTFVVFSSNGLYDAYLLKKNDYVTKNALNSQVTSREDLEELLDSFELIKKRIKGKDGTTLLDFALKNKVSRGFIYTWFPELENNVTSSIKVGPFDVIGKIDDKQMALLEKVVKKSADILKKNGYGHLLYGTLSVSASSNSNVIADYTSKGDHIVFYPNALTGSDANVKTMVHELGHRQWYKFKTDQDDVKIKFYKTTESTTKQYKKGMRFLYANPNDKGREGNIGVIQKRAKQKVTFRVYDPEKLDKANQTPWDYTEISVMLNAIPKYFKNMDGTEIVNTEHFAVSNYAMTKITEFFAELFAYGNMGWSDKSVFEYIKEIAKK